MAGEATLVERLEEVDFAKVVFPRGRKEGGDIIEAEAQKFDKRKEEYVKCPSIFLTFAYNKQGVLNQVFVSQGKSGGDENAHAQSLAILTSIGLQHGIPPQAFIRTLEGIQADVRPFEEMEGPKTKVVYSSIEDLIARKLTEYVLGREEPLAISELGETEYSQQVLNDPDEVDSRRKKLSFGDPNLQPLYMHLDHNPEGLLTSVFLTRGKSGGDESAHAESLGKLISLSLQYGLHPFRVVRSLEGMSSPSVIYMDGHIYQSIEDAIGRSIFDWYLKREVDLAESYHRVMNGDTDPTDSLEVPDFDLEGIGGDEAKKPCPNPECGRTDYELIPISAKCGKYSCCDWSYGSCD